MKEVSYFIYSFSLSFFLSFLLSFFLSYVIHVPYLPPRENPLDTRPNRIPQSTFNSCGAPS